MTTRICKVCGCQKEAVQGIWVTRQGKPVGRTCLACHAEKKRQWRAVPENAVLDAQYTARSLAKPEVTAKINLTRRAYRARALQAKPARAKQYAASYRSIAKRRKTDPWFRLAEQLRTRTWRILNNLARGRGTEAACNKLFGADRQTVKAWFESMFRPGMGWHNYQEVWVCDHWWPVAMAQSDVELRQCFLLDNCNVLTHEEHKLKTLEDGRLFKR